MHPHPIGNFVCNNKTDLIPEPLVSSRFHKLFRRESVAYACLRSDSSELSPVRFVFKLGADTDHTLSFERASLTLAGRRRRARLEADSAAAGTEYAARYCVSCGPPDWSGPLQRVAFWTGCHVQGAPLVPTRRVCASSLSTSGSGHTSTSCRPRASGTSG